MTKCKVIAFANQKGGTKKITTILNLGVSFAKQGQKNIISRYCSTGRPVHCIRMVEADNFLITLATQKQKDLAR